MVICVTAVDPFAGRPGQERHSQEVNLVTDIPTTDGEAGYALLGSALAELRQKIEENKEFIVSGDSLPDIISRLDKVTGLQFLPLQPMYYLNGAKLD